MTTTPRKGTSSTPERQVMVVLGKAPADLTDGLRAGGLVQIAEDGDITVWGEPTLAPQGNATSWRGVVTRTGPTRLLMTVADAALALGLGRSTVYELIGRGELEVIHVGRSARIPADAVRSLVERLRSDQSASDAGDANAPTETCDKNPHRRIS